MESVPDIYTRMAPLTLPEANHSGKTGPLSSARLTSATIATCWIPATPSVGRTSTNRASTQLSCAKNSIIDGCKRTVWHSAASRKGEEQRFGKASTSHVPPLCHVERSATTPWAILQNLKRGVETPREGFGLHSAAGNFPDAAASEQVGRAQPLPATFQEFVQRSPPAEVTGCASETHFSGGFPRTAVLPPALAGGFDFA